jgi:hypothetical protein
VKVELVDCQSGLPLPGYLPEYTDANGFYLFDNLIPGEYCVQFDLDTVPADTCDFGSPQFTTQNAGDDKAVDSDANPATGVTPPVILGAGETNLTVDAGIVCQECNITIDKKCLVVPPVSENFVCSDAKPIDSLTMIWNGTEGIRIKAWKGSVGSTLLADIDNIEPSEEVTVTGFAGSPNDVYWEIFAAGTENKIGESTFHLSCSDDDMNGPEDCGKFEGDGKDKAGFINDWLFEGMAGNGLALDCTPNAMDPLDECSFEAPPPPNCDTLGKPTSLTFQYTGKDCTASDNDQPSDKFECSGVPGDDPVSITIVKNPNKFSVSPESGINQGDLVTLTAYGADLGAEVQLYVGGQFLKFHTSCSQPLAAGDIFGSLKLLQFNGQGSGAEVTYSYVVKNIGTSDVDITSVSDDKLGELLASTTPLSAGDSFTLETTAFIDKTTTNTVTATADIPNTDIRCGEAMDSVTVTVTEPTCDVKSVFDRLDDDKIKYKLTNTGKIVATLDTLTVNFPDAYGAIKEVKLDGAIFKASDSNIVVGPDKTIGANDWTNPDVSKRQLDPGETRTLEVVFTQKAKEDWVNIDPVGSATFEETCAVSLKGPAGCEIGKPTALVFQYTGEGCVGGNDQASDKWSCSGSPGADPVNISIVEDPNKITVSPSNEINVGDLVTISAIGSDMGTEVQLYVGGQFLKFHTSCSQPLNEGDQFGSFVLKQFIPKP